MKRIILFFAIALCLCSANKAISQVVDSGTTGDCTWTLTGTADNYKLTFTAISDDGAMGNYTSSGSMPWYSYLSDIKTVDIQQGVTTIGNYAFYECSGLTSVIIPNSVTTIGNRTFMHCSSLTSVTIPNSTHFTTVGNEAFYGCSGLTSITIGNSVTSIGNYAFYYCSLDKIFCLSPIPPSISSNTFSFSHYGSATLHVEEPILYQAANYWSSFTQMYKFVNIHFVNDIIQDKATLHGSVASGFSVDVVGVEYKLNTDAHYTIVLVNNDDGESFTCNLTGLSFPNKVYQYRAFVVYDNDTLRGDIGTFRTPRAWDGTHTAWTTGDGTESNPYLISNANELAHLAYTVNNGIGAGTGNIVGINKHWKLVANIDLEGDNDFMWTPIGYYNSDADWYAFGGHFDGNGYAISNLYVWLNNLQRAGLFGYTSGGSIKGTGIANGNITNNNNNTNVYAGGIVGYADNTTIDNCYNGSSISTIAYSLNSHSGGIAGYATSNISNCYNRGSVSAYSSYDSYSGGIAGYATSNISNCYNTGSILANTSYLGGIAGYGDNNINVTNSYYLVSCGGNNTYGGASKTEVFMKTQEFVDLLNDGNFVYKMDVNPFANDGYPIFYNYISLIIRTDEATDINKNSATLNGYIEEGSWNITSSGFQYKEAGFNTNIYATPTVTDNQLSCSVSGLKSNTNYEYRVFAVNSNNDTAYSTFVNFTTTPFNVDTTRNYFLIETRDDLLQLAELVNSGSSFSEASYLLANDITLPLNQPNNMVSIGNYETEKPFMGTFIGNGKLITNVYIDNPNTPYQGFFGYTKNAYLHEVGLVDITASGRNYTGGMVAYAENTHIKDCYVNGGTLYSLTYVGGLVGYQSSGTNSIISGCYNACAVTANSYVGGIVGYSDHATVRNSYVIASVSGQDVTTVGAIIGGAVNVLMYNCNFSTEITGQTKAIGDNRTKSNEGLSNEEMQTQEFVDNLNQGLTEAVWRMDYSVPINNGFPILIWQRSNGSCEPPVNLHVVEVNGVDVSLKWQGATDGHFLVEYTKVGGNSKTLSTYSTSVTLTGLDEESEYSWKVKNMCAEGESSFETGSNFITEKEVVGIDTHTETDKQIVIYPNPAENTLYIRSSLSVQQICIYDIYGRLLKQLSNLDSDVDLTDLATGMYFVNIKTSQGETMKQLVINR
jgi:hypothetical protein